MHFRLLARGPSKVLVFGVRVPFSEGWSENDVQDQCDRFNLFLKASTVGDMENIRRMNQTFDSRIQ